MMASFASRAPTSPPDTGASRVATDFARASAWIRTARDGSEVLMSQTTLPGRSAGKHAVQRQVHFLDLGGKPDHREHHFASLRHLAGGGAPGSAAARRSAAFSRVRVVRAIAWPAFNRWPHIDLPMTPIPIHPIAAIAVPRPFYSFSSGGSESPSLMTGPSPGAAQRTALRITVCTSFWWYVGKVSWPGRK